MNVRCVGLYFYNWFVEFGNSVYISTHIISDISANTRRSANVRTMLARPLRRSSNIVPALGERLVFAGIAQMDDTCCDLFLFIEK